MLCSGSSGRGIPQPYAFRGEDMPRKPLEGCLRPAMRGIARWQRAAGFPGRCRRQCVMTLSRQGCPIGYREEPARRTYGATRQQQRAGATRPALSTGEKPRQAGADKHRQGYSIAGKARANRRASLTALAVTLRTQAQRLGDQTNPAPLHNWRSSDAGLPSKWI